MSDDITDPTPNFSEVLSRAVQARGLSLDRIRARLEAAGVPVSNATLSYWQSGRSLPTRARSLRTLVELEAILQLEPGTLIELIRTADGRTRHRLFAWQTVVPSGELAEQIRPGLWDSLPDAARKALQSRIHQQTPKVVEKMLGEMRADLPRFVDVQYLAVTTVRRQPLCNAVALGGCPQELWEIAGNSGDQVPGSILAHRDGPVEIGPARSARRDRPGGRGQAPGEVRSWRREHT